MECIYERVKPCQHVLKEPWTAERETNLIPTFYCLPLQLTARLKSLEQIQR
jgi:hypothetical protein